MTSTVNNGCRVQWAHGRGRHEGDVCVHLLRGSSLNYNKSLHCTASSASAYYCWIAATQKYNYNNKWKNGADVDARKTQANVAPIESGRFEDLTKIDWDWRQYFYTQNQLNRHKIQEVKQCEMGHPSLRVNFSVIQSNERIIIMIIIGW